MSTRYEPQPTGAAPDRHEDLDRVLRALPPEEAARLRDVWALAADAAPEPVLDPDALARTDQLLSALASETPARNEARIHRLDRPAVPLARRHAWRRLALGVAAAGLVALAAIAWVARPVTLTAPLGERVAVHLGDGSTVSLNSGSTLTHDRRFGRADGGARTVRLEGEAFFDVTHGDIPFIVQTADAEVVVLGTRFGVRAWPGEGETTVALQSGRVRLTPSDAPEATVVLRPGEVARVADGTPQPAVSDTGVDDALAWQNGDLVYKNRPLAEVLADVERRFGIYVTPQPDALGGRRVSVALRGPASAEAVVRDLAAALGLRYRARADGFELYPDPSPSAGPSR